MNKRGLAYVAVGLATFGWALSPIFIRHMRSHYDPYTQALVRYFAAACLLTAYSLCMHRTELARAFKNPAMIGLAVVNIMNQAAWTIAICTPGTSATVAQLLSKLQLPAVIVLSYFLFREERAIIRSRLFLAGSLAGLIGVCGVLIHDPQTTLIPELNFATMLLLFLCIGWAVYVVWAKHSVTSLNPIPVFTVVAIYTTTGFVVLSCCLGEPSSIIKAGPWMGAFALGSGILPIAVAHTSYFYGQKYLGAAFCGSILLLNPLITHVIARFVWPDESLIWIQWIGAALLTFGCLAVIYAERKAARSTSV